MSDVEHTIKYNLNAYEVDEWEMLSPVVRDSICRSVGGIILEKQREIDSLYRREEFQEERIGNAEMLFESLMVVLDKAKEDPNLNRSKKMTQLVKDLVNCFSESMFEM